MRPRFSLPLTGLLAFAAAGGGCGSSQPAESPRKAPAPAAAVTASGAAATPPWLAGSHFADATDVVGPYVGTNGRSALAAWAEASEGGRSLFALPLSAAGRPGAPVRLGLLAGDLELLAVRSLGVRDQHARFGIVATRREKDKTRIDVSMVGENGVATWGPSNLVERGATVLWIGLLEGTSPLLLWAEQPFGQKRGEPASVFAIALDAERGAPGEVTLVAAKVCAWQVAERGGHAALATVRPSGPRCTGGSVSVDLLGATGKPSRSIDLGGNAELDLDLVPSGDGFLLAWSDHRGIEGRVYTALLDGGGNVAVKPRPAAAAVGEQAVVALLESGGKARAYLVWESTSEQPAGARHLEVSALGDDARESGPRARLLYGRSDGGVPELSKFGDGLAALTLAPACPLTYDCPEKAPPVPTFVAFDAALSVRSSEPFLLEPLRGRAADLGWGLTCGSNDCFALAATSKSPTALYSVPLPLRAALYRSAAEPAGATSRPRVVTSDIVARARESLAHLALADFGGRRALGYVTDFDPTTPWQKLTKPASDGRLEPLRARIALRALDVNNAGEGAEAALDSAEQVISLRAHSLGGLSLVAADARSRDALAIWTGLDRGEPQVFLTTLSIDGKRAEQRMLTRKQGDASDVAGLALDNGYLIAWVDERSADPELYASRVTRSLERKSPDQRITTSDGAAAEVGLGRVGGKPYVIWSDTRAAEQPGWADLYGAFLRPNDATRDGIEHRLTATRAHSFSPQLGDAGGTAVLGWLEEGLDGAPASVRVVGLGENGELASSVVVVPLPEAVPRALGMACSKASCRLVVSVDVQGRGELYALEWRPGESAPKVTSIATLGSAGAAGVPPLVRGDDVFAADVRDGQGLVRRLGIEW